MIRCGASAVFAFVLAATPAPAQDWRTYVNPRFGATADVLRDWRAGQPPENGDGLQFTSPTGRRPSPCPAAEYLSTPRRDGAYSEPNGARTITTRTPPTPIGSCLGNTRRQDFFYRKSFFDLRQPDLEQRLDRVSGCAQAAIQCAGGARSRSLRAPKRANSNCRKGARWISGT